jgi:hypothetical protein
MCTLMSTKSVEEKISEPLPEMVPLRSLPHSQRQLFGLSLNGRPELDLMVKNPVKHRKLVTPSPARRMARTLNGSSMDATKRKAVLEGLADVVADLEDTHNVRVINTERTNLERKHVLLPLDQLIGLLDSCFVCKGCYLPGSHMIEKVSIGIATSLNVFCSTVGCAAGGSITAGVRKNGIRVKQDKWKAHRCVPASKVAAGAFDLNMHLVLAMQQIGGVGSEAIVLGTMLDLCPAALANQFTTMEDALCLMQQRVGMEHLEDNLKLEKNMENISILTLPCPTEMGPLGGAIQFS